MSDAQELQLFEGQTIRTAWDEQAEEWYFSIVDVIGVLTQSPNPNNYWKVLKKRLSDEGSQLVTNCNQLKLKSSKDGKRYKTDVATTEQLLRLIQVIPSPKAEPLKLWLAQVGRERIDETLDPELIAERLVDTYIIKIFYFDGDIGINFVELSNKSVNGGRIFPCTNGICPQSNTDGFCCCLGRNCRSGCTAGSGFSAACQQAERHQHSQNKCQCLFHGYRPPKN